MHGYSKRLEDAPVKVGYRITLRKERSTWYWTTFNPQGGSFGMNYQGSKAGALGRAMRGVPVGDRVYVNTFHGSKFVSRDLITK